MLNIINHAGHGDHHPIPGHVFPGQPPAHVLPTPVGPGVTQPPDIPDTAKGSPLPHWDGVLIGTSITTINPTNNSPSTKLANLYVNGAFNYGDFSSVEQALTATKLLTAPADKPAAVIWKDKFGIVHAQALLEFGGTVLHPLYRSPFVMSSAPTAAHLFPGMNVNLGHPEALYVVDGDLVYESGVPATVPVPANGGTGWNPAGGES